MGFGFDKMGKGNGFMNWYKKYIPLIIMLCFVSGAFSQQKELKGFVQKYFYGIDITEDYSKIISDLNNVPDMTNITKKPDNGLYPFFITFKIINHPLLKNDSAKAYINYNLTVNIDTRTKQTIDSVFSLHLVVYYGKDKAAKKQTIKEFNTLRREIKNYSRIYNTSSYHKPGNAESRGHSYEFNNKISIPAPLTLLWGKNLLSNYELKISYSCRYTQ